MLCCAMLLPHVYALRRICCIHVRPGCQMGLAGQRCAPRQPLRCAAVQEQQVRRYLTYRGMSWWRCSEALPVTVQATSKAVCQLQPLRHFSCTACWKSMWVGGRGQGLSAVVVPAHQALFQILCVSGGECAPNFSGCTACSVYHNQ
jgi:hypothetical protein